MSTLHRAAEIGERVGLRYVYLGNVWGDPREHTYCPGCGELVMHRMGYHVQNRLRDGYCPKCGTAIAGVWS
jgi:pyruvate formate lyase activating enzyme